MSKGIYVGIDGVCRKVKAIYVGVDGVCRKVIRGYVGIDGVCRQFYSSTISAKTENMNLILNQSSSLYWDYRHYDFGLESSDSDSTNTLVSDNITSLNKLSFSFTTGGDYGFIVSDSKIDFNCYQYIYVSVSLNNTGLNWTPVIALSSNKTTHPNINYIYAFNPQSHSNQDPNTRGTLVIRCDLPSIEEGSHYLKSGIYISGSNGTTSLNVNYIILSNNPSLYSYDQAVTPE